MKFAKVQLNIYSKIKDAADLQTTYKRIVEKLKVKRANNNIIIVSRLCKG